MAELSVIKTFSILPLFHSATLQLCNSATFQPLTMFKLILTRLLAAVPLLLALSILTFGLVHLIPGSVAAILLGEGATQENIAKLEAELGLDQPLVQQYGRWLSGVTQGDWGRSLRSKRPILEMISEKFPATLSLTGSALLIAIVVGLFAGILAAARPGTWWDRVGIAGTSLGISIPDFWAAVLLSIFFAAKLGWFPVIGFTPITQNPLKWLHGLVLPALALGIPSSAIIARQMRAALGNELEKIYIRSLRAAGISERSILLKHALKNALIPVVTVIGFQVPVLLGGSFVVEQVFAIPGLGSLIVNAVLQQDLPLIQGLVLLTGLLIVLTNLLVDVSYAWLNPKVRVT